MQKSQALRPAEKETSGLPNNLFAPVQMLHAFSSYLTGRAHMSGTNSMHFFPAGKRLINFAAIDRRRPARSCGCHVKVTMRRSAPPSSDTEDVLAVDPITVRSE